MIKERSERCNKRRTWPTIADFEIRGRGPWTKKYGKHLKATKSNKFS